MDVISTCGQHCHSTKSTFSIPRQQNCNDYHPWSTGLWTTLHYTDRISTPDSSKEVERGRGEGGSGGMTDVREGRQRHRVGGWGWGGGEVVRGGRQDAGAHLRMVFLILLQDLDAQLRQVHDVFQFLLWRHIFTQHFCSQQQPQLTHPLACSTLLLTVTTPTYTISGLLNPSAHSHNPNLPFPNRSINPNLPFPIKLERTQDVKIQLLICSQNRISSRIRMQILNEQFKDSIHTIQNIC